MNKIITTALICLLMFSVSPTPAAIAAAQAVSATNYELRFNTADIYSQGNRVSYYHQFGVAGTFPLGTYIGASISGHYGNTTLLPAYENNTLNAAYPWGECGYRSTGVATMLFARRPSIGRIDIGYASDRLDSHCEATFIASGTNSLNSNTYNGDVEYYFPRVTITAAWSHTRIKTAGEQTADSLTTAWYPTSQGRIELTADGRDLKNTYDVDVEYQPKFLDNSLGIIFDYTTQHRGISNQTYMLGLRYYFGTHVDLLQRDRFYR